MEISNNTDYFKSLLNFRLVLNKELYDKKIISYEVFSEFEKNIITKLKEI